MFTGLVQGMGKVESLQARGGQMRLTIRALFELADIVLGESIAVNGACLTVESGGSNAFTAYASAETLDKTSLGGLGAGSLVNLERALALGDRLGGHLVSGHVDCLATVRAVEPAGESRRITMDFPEEFGPLVVEKGSVALDGVSLTVNACGKDWLSVNIIPATQGETTINSWAPGRAVNMETDIIGKYVARMLGPYPGAAKPSRITEDFLRQHGF
ncbi:riboflavin synthase [Fundidesulfovibrio soli]|uniref:riboflavin synthase n=1 Tax=Fundidesulfovibrio soli TaxID=2922716 RepID=UPI001FAFDDFC|nr:riboflavin synthase [Fundidesulfovibrio soli]